ncbi:type II secretion system minor pseudopilin GspJ [Endozoicomonas sp. Mp262]|uniref:type II secretion system minor pseudopilin GspJ n=1 Tax=Endozoicomonas sp. Mp262 TaxID=2919499 RepID=UPI0021D8D4BF
MTKSQASACLNFKRRNTGFTLLEMLAAIAIFAIVSLASWQIMQSLLRAHDMGTAKHQRMEELQYAMLIIDQDLRQIVDRGPRVDGKVIQQSLFSSDDMLETDDQALAFVREGWHNPSQRLPRSELQRVYYRLKDNHLERLHDYVLDKPSATEPVKRLLLSNVSHLKFRFFINGTWQEKLDDSKTLPEGLALELELKDLGKIERLFILPGNWKGEAA